MAKNWNNNKLHLIQIRGTNDNHKNLFYKIDKLSLDVGVSYIKALWGSTHRKKLQTNMQGNRYYVFVSSK